MNSTAKPSSACSSRICCRISRWTTTSSAVVGSSMITSSGRSASAIAMTTRWRMPPESSCGYARSGRLSMPTRSSRSPARASASRFEIALVRAHHVDELVADAHHRVERVHRALEDHRDVSPTEPAKLFAAKRRRRPRRRRGCRPLVTCAGERSTCITALPSVLLPQPDSPARPMISPGADRQRDAVDCPGRALRVT